MIAPLPRAYLAGPDVFRPDAVALGRRKQALARRYGFDGLFPLTDDPLARDVRRDRAIYDACREMMERADLGLFNLTPFRGPSADPGTVLELGVMIAMGKPCFGYTNTDADLLARLRIAGVVTGDAATGWRDADGNAIEDFGNADNLMIDACLAGGMNGLVRVHADGQIDDMRGFEACLRLARARLFDDVAPPNTGALPDSQLGQD